MAKLKIPDNVKIGFIKFFFLKKQKINLFFRILKKQTPTLYVSELVGRIHEEVGVPANDLHQIIDSLISLVSAQNQFDVPEEKLIYDFSEAILEDEDFLSDNWNLDTVKAVVTKVFEIDLLYIIGKATSVMNENQNTLRSTQVIADIRPIFGRDVSKKPISATLIFDLVLRYGKSNHSLNNFHISMDLNDVEVLILHLQRAQEKAKSLAKFLKDSDIPTINGPES